MPIFLRIPLVLEVASDLTHGLKRNVIQLITEQFNFFFFCIFVFQSWVTPRVHLSNLETAVLGNPHLPKAKISFLIQNSDPLKSLKKGTGFLLKGSWAPFWTEGMANCTPLPRSHTTASREGHQGYWPANTALCPPVTLSHTTGNLGFQCTLYRKGALETKLAQIRSCQSIPRILAFQWKSQIILQPHIYLGRAASRQARAFRVLTVANLAAAELGTYWFPSKRVLFRCATCLSSVAQNDPHLLSRFGKLLSD